MSASPDLQFLIEEFVARWAPTCWKRSLFINELRKLLEAYGKAALIHQSLPDTEHRHGGPV